MKELRVKVSLQRLLFCFTVCCIFSCHFAYRGNAKISWCMVWHEMIWLNREGFKFQLLLLFGRAAALWSSSIPWSFPYVIFVERTLLPGVLLSIGFLSSCWTWWISLKRSIIIIIIFNFTCWFFMSLIFSISWVYDFINEWNFLYADSSWV